MFVDREPENSWQFTVSCKTIIKPMASCQLIEGDYVVLTYNSSFITYNYAYSLLPKNLLEIP